MSFFIEVKSKYKFSKKNLNLLIEKLKKFRRIGLVSTLQFLDQEKEIGRFLKQKGKVVLFSLPVDGLKKGQIIGCNVGGALSIEKKVDAFLFVGSGLFHPIMLALKTKKPVFYLSETFGSASEKAEKIKRKIRSNLIKLLESNEVGILISIKPGQINLEKARNVKKILEKLGKRVCLFLFDNFQPEQLENFPDLAFINSACPGISIETGIPYIDDVLEFLNEVI